MKIRKKNDRPSSILEHELPGLIARKTGANDFAAGLEVRPLRQIQDDGRAEIHRGKRKSPAKDVAADKQATVGDLEAHVLGAIKHQKGEYQQTGRDTGNPKRLFGLMREDADS